MTSDNNYQPAEKLVLESIEALKVYFDPMRQKIVQEIVSEAKSVHEIADVLKVPFTRLYYHINLLEKHKIIEVVEIRSMSGAVEEKYYQVAAYQFIVPRSLLSFNTPEAEKGINILLKAVLDETREDIRRSIQSGKVQMQEESPHPDSLLLRRGLLKLSKEKATEFHKDLLELVRKYQADSADESALPYGLALAVYPSAFLETEAREANEELD